MAMTLPAAATLFQHLPRYLRRHRLMLGWMRLTGENPLQLVRIRERHYGYADMSDGFLRLIVIEGQFEADFFRIADAVLADGGTFIDVGANHGLLSFGLAGRYADKVNFHMFEPNPRLISSIERSLALYPTMRCRVNRMVLSDQVGNVFVEFNPEQSGISHMVYDGSDEKAISTTLDSYLEKEGISQVDFLKIDVEGFELAVLRGATRHLRNQSIQALYFEYMEKYLDRVRPFGDPLELLQSFGYQVCFCRLFDLEANGGPTHTLRKDLPGHGIPLLPIQGHRRPKGSDLFAVPNKNLVSWVK